MKKIFCTFIIVLSIFFNTGCNNTVDNSRKAINNMKVEINNKEYIINLEDNKTTKEFIELLPLELEMNELNGNEKYAYLDKSLSNNSSNIKHINAGDVMLFGDDCLVIFYKSFDTSYSYTKIGHINNIQDLGKNNVKVIFKK